MMSLDLKQITIPLDRAGFEQADRLASGLATVEQGKRVYLNTLAVWAVYTYLSWLGIESEPSLGDSGQASLTTVMDVADLVVPGVGRLECRPVLPGAGSFVIPLEACCDGPTSDPQNRCIGYVAVRFHESLESVDLIGFLESFPADDPPLEPPIISLDDLLPVDALLNALHPISRLRQWLEGAFDSGQWQPTASLVAASNRSAVSPQVQEGISLPSLDQGVSRAKIIALGESPWQAVVLAIEVTPTAEDAQILEVRLRLYPHRDADHLPRHLQIAILNDAGTVLSEATTGDEEVFIQLELQDCRPGEQFSVGLTLQGNSVIEEFMV